MLTHLHRWKIQVCKQYIGLWCLWCCGLQTLNFILWFLAGEVRSICESVCSDGSNATVQAGGSNQRPRMDIACVLDISQTSNMAHRKRALEEVRLASELVNANVHHIHVSMQLGILLLS